MIVQFIYTANNFFPGIATEMIKARTSMLQHYRLELTSTGYSSIGAQKAAQKAGCTIDHKIRLTVNPIPSLILIIFEFFSYKELADMKSNWNFMGTHSEFYVQSSIKLVHN